jgi:hypothetical protein
MYLIVAVLLDQKQERQRKQGTQLRNIMRIAVSAERKQGAANLAEQNQWHKPLEVAHCVTYI